MCEGVRVCVKERERERERERDILLLCVRDTCSHVTRAQDRLLGSTITDLKQRVLINLLNFCSF